MENNIKQELKECHSLAVELYNRINGLHNRLQFDSIFLGPIWEMIKTGSKFLVQNLKQFYVRYQQIDRRKNE